MEQKKREQTAHITIRLTESTVDILQRVADWEGRTRSDICREMLEKGLVAAGYMDGAEDLATLVHRTVTDAIKPQADRLASISAKAAQIAAATFFLNAWIGNHTLPEYLLEDFKEISENARRLGAQYLKVSRDRSLDGFISSSLQKMGDEFP